MQDYEIRLVKPAGRPSVHAGRFLGDYQAIRHACSLAGKGDAIEVWRGMHCIYRQNAPPERSAA
jgi:hypothetical protein